MADEFEIPDEMRAQMLSQANAAIAAASAAAQRASIAAERAIAASASPSS